MVTDAKAMTLILVPGTYYWNEELTTNDVLYVVLPPTLMDTSKYSSLAIEYRRKCAKELYEHYKRRGINVRLVSEKEYDNGNALPPHTDNVYFYDPTDYDISTEFINRGYKQLDTKTFYFKTALFDAKEFWTDIALCNYAKKKSKLFDGINKSYDSQCRNKLKSPLNSNVPEVQLPTSLITRKSAMNRLGKFFDAEISTGRFCEYQDSIDFVTDRSHYSYAAISSHSGLSAAMNIGIINPGDILEKIRSAKITEKNVSSIEAYFRQIFGWREYMRMIWYKGPIAKVSGVNKNIGTWADFESRGLTSHYIYQKNRRINDLPKNKLLEIIEESARLYGYVHHIERLMILGNWFFLHRTDPVDVYNYFLRMTIDAYPWVMYGNVVYMSQYTFGSVYTRKAYYSSGNYIRHMALYDKNDKAVTSAIDSFDTAFHKFKSEANGKYARLSPLYR